MGEMIFTVGNNILISNPISQVRDWCNANLVLDNPDYYKKQQMGKWLGSTPQSIYLYEKRGTDSVVPFGCLYDLYRMFSKYQWKPLFCPIRQVSYNSSIKLYEYQEKAVNEALKSKNGILVMPCGSGKTQSGLEFISRIGGKALWLTHTQDLLNQSMSRAKSVFSNAGFGTITGGRVNIGTHITFATVQTMAKLDLSEYKDEWDIIIVDECQHCCGSPTRVTQFYKVISRLCARYKIGLTATPRRADGLERSMFTLLGSIIHEVSQKEVEHTTCPVKVRQIKTKWTPDYDCVLMGDGTIDYHKVVDAMTESKERFEVVMQTLKSLPKGDRIMVLGNRVEYLNRLCDAYNQDNVGDAICISGTANNKYGKAERKRALLALEDGDINCIFATYQLAKEGLDVPKLKYVVFATPEKDETTVIQSAGRVGRKAEGKEYGTVIDFVDEFGMYAGWTKKRMRSYKKINAEILT